MKRLKVPRTDYVIRYLHLDPEDYFHFWRQLPRPTGVEALTLALFCCRDTGNPEWYGMSFRVRGDHPNKRLGKVIAVGRALAASRGRNGTRWYGTEKMPAVYGAVGEHSPLVVREFAVAVSEERQQRNKPVAGR